MTLDELAALKANGNHSIFSPSSAAMWTHCTGSLVANALADHDSAGEDAAIGTAAHTMADEWLRTGVRLCEREMQVDRHTVTVDSEMLAYVEQYVDWVQDARGHHYFEQRVDFSSLMPIAGQTGTADHFAATFGEMTITDLKYGKGVKVYAKDNPQAQLYAVGVFLEWDWYYGFETIHIRICQPRLDHFDTWTITRADLLAFMEWIRERAAAAWVPDAPRMPSEKACLWCKVKRTCPAFLTWFDALAQQQADDVFGIPEMQRAADRAADDLATQAPIQLVELSVEAWCQILPMRKAVEAWFAAGEAKVFRAAQAGFSTPGYKIVEGRSNRAWKDEADAQARMVEVGIPISETETRKMISPNQAEEALHGAMRMPKKKAAALFESFTERKDGGLSLVTVSDKREAVPSHGDVFDEE